MCPLEERSDSVRRGDTWRGPRRQAPRVESTRTDAREEEVRAGLQYPRQISSNSARVTVRASGPSGGSSSARNGSIRIWPGVRARTLSAVMVGPPAVPGSGRRVKKVDAVRRRSDEVGSRAVVAASTFSDEFDARRVPFGVVQAPIRDAVVGPSPRMMRARGVVDARSAATVRQPRPGRSERPPRSSRRRSRPGDLLHARKRWRAPVPGHRTCHVSPRNDCGFVAVVLELAARSSTWPSSTRWTRGQAGGDTFCACRSHVLCAPSRRAAPPPPRGRRGCRHCRSGAHGSSHERERSDVVVELELVRVRAQPDRVDLVGALVVDPGLDQVRR